MRPFFVPARAIIFAEKTEMNMIFNFGIDGEIGPWGYSKGYVRSELNKYKGKPVTVRINSLGGSVDHGLAIAAQFKEHGDVTAVLVGCVASAATVASLGAKKIIMDANGMYLAHKVSNWVEIWGQMNADQMEAKIKELQASKKNNEQFDLVLGRMYAKKCGKEVKDVVELMKAETWLTADEALRLGVVDEVQELGDGKIADINDRLNAMKLPPLPGANKTWIRRLCGIFTEQNQNNTTNMNEKFKHVANLLKDVTIADGKATITEEQVGAINGELERLNGVIADRQKEQETLQNKIKELEDQVKNLQSAPGAVTAPTVTDEGNEELSPADMFNEIKSLI